MNPTAALNMQEGEVGFWWNSRMVRQGVERKFNKIVRAKVQEGMYGNAGTSRYVLRPHGPPDCAAIVKNAEKHMNACIEDDDVLGGTVEEGVTGLDDFDIAALDQTMKEKTSRTVKANEEWMAGLTESQDEGGEEEEGEGDEGDEEEEGEGDEEEESDEEANLEVDLENKKKGGTRITEADKQIAGTSANIIWKGCSRCIEVRERG